MALLLAIVAQSADRKAIPFFIQTDRAGGNLIKNKGSSLPSGRLSVLEYTGPRTIV